MTPSPSGKLWTRRVLMIGRRKWRADAWLIWATDVVGHVTSRRCSLSSVGLCVLILFTRLADYLTCITYHISILRHGQVPSMVSGYFACCSTLHCCPEQSEQPRTQLTHVRAHQRVFFCIVVFGCTSLPPPTTTTWCCCHRRHRRTLRQNLIRSRPALINTHYVHIWNRYKIAVHSTP